MDVLARELGLDPLELRRRNYADARPGQESPVLRASGSTSATGWAPSGSAGGRARSVERREPVGASAPRRRHGVAHLGRGRRAAGVRTVRINRDGTIEVLTGAQDLGTGARTVLAQIAAEVLGAKVERRPHDARRHRATALRVELVGIDHDGVGRAGGARRGRGGARLAVRGGRGNARHRRRAISNRRTARFTRRPATGACASATCAKSSAT